MSLHRRILIGLPSVGLTVFTALALSAPASAAQPADVAAFQRAAAATTSPADSDDTRGGSGYGAADDTPDVAPTSDTTTPSRGKPGYGSVSPTTPAPTTPSATSDEVPPGVSPASVTPSEQSPAGGSVTPAGGGVSPASTLPVTGAPMGTIVALGSLMVAAGATSVWYTRRRRSA